MFWEAERHEALCDQPWDEAAARQWLGELCAAAEAAYSDESLWPRHPLDAELPGPATALYWGASGIAWALDQLHRRGAITATRPWLDEAQQILDRHLAAPGIGDNVPSLMLGELGIRLIADADHDRIYELIESNIENETLEMLWGAPGTMLGAVLMFERTGDGRWRALYRRNVEFLLRTWEHHPNDDVWIWTQHLYGEVVRLLGAGHGFAGNVFALLRGAALLSDSERASVAERAAHTLVTTAMPDGDLANWSPHVGAPRKGREAILVQWCHGAPGMILGLAGPPRDDIDDLFVAGAEMTWRAGPLTKGPGLCHGTAGNGYTFLAMHARTGDEVWLERARRFAMHTVAQARSAAAEHGDWRYSLWTGDVGAAVYVLDCIDGRGELPGLTYL